MTNSTHGDVTHANCDYPSTRVVRSVDRFASLGCSVRAPPLVPSNSRTRDARQTAFASPSSQTNRLGVPALARAGASDSEKRSHCYSVHGRRWQLSQTQRFAGLTRLVKPGLVPSYALLLFSWRRRVKSSFEALRLFSLRRSLAVLGNDLAEIRLPWSFAPFSSSGTANLSWSNQPDTVSQLRSERLPVLWSLR